MDVSKPVPIKHFKSRSDYLSNSPVNEKLNSQASSKAKETVSKKAKKLLSKTKELGKKTLPDSTKIKAGLKETKDAGKFLLKEAAQSGVSTITDMVGLTGSIEDTSESLATKKTKSTNKAKKVSKSVAQRNIQKPVVAFIKGMELFGISTNNDGLEEMAQGIDNSEIYSWKDQDKIMQQIKQHSRKQPVILVGHSMGGDVAVNIANELNTAKHGFRKVDLLITMDSVGFNNDIVPENVEKNLNFISSSPGLFNDGPNIAKSLDKTVVVNELREEAHRGLDNAPEIQRKVMDEIFNTTLDSIERSSAQLDLIKLLPHLKTTKIDIAALN